eukprot:gene10129-8030_t
MNFCLTSLLAHLANSDTGPLRAGSVASRSNQCKFAMRLHRTGLVRCVPQRVDEGIFPVPPDCALDRTFDLNSFQGRWYITAGLNPLFDQFDCQEHFFAVPEAGKLIGKINWFLLLKIQPADEDDWYIIANKTDEYLFIYYNGNNDAWKGYGGATVYTREKELPAKYIPELKAAATAAGINWDDMKITDNTCGPHPPLPKGFVDVLRQDVLTIEDEFEDTLKSFGRGFTVLEDEVLQAEEKIQREIVLDLQDAEKEFLGFERELAMEEETLMEKFKSFFGLN